MEIHIQWGKSMEKNKKTIKYILAQKQNKGKKANNVQNGSSYQLGHNQGPTTHQHAEAQAWARPA